MSDMMQCQQHHNSEAWKETDLFLMNIMMTKISHTDKVHHMRVKRQMAQSLGQIAKFKRRYQLEAEENNGK
ncbi:hypothetical protein E2562_010130 [Oryza meyeriana var. granulata]|uniref:Uncharacterized protein n=1 Tax=Oryza meyeriana var. granulata TaxID=110450 RepID=A0A6G1EKJ8_9ORYZ|nr:hypothetical protein E2562_010130 [Oryza meyeriana var. granulata]